ncbi:MAG: hypothetical protein Phog2KO_36520 [Phototrophicaceae bacterium]
MLEFIVAVILIVFFGLFLALSFPMKEDIPQFNDPQKTRQSE